MPKRKLIEVVPPVDVAAPPATELETSDLHFAAYLRARNVKLLRTVREGNRVAFVYAGGAETAALQTAWYDTTGMVSALAFSNAIKNLKDLCYSI
jgi:hypothetical protein